MDSDVLNQVLEVAGTLNLWNVLGAIAAVIIGAWLAKRVRRGLPNLLNKKEGLDQTIVRLAATLAYWGVLIMAFMVAMTIIGVGVSPLVPILGAAGLGVGLAMEGSLSNLAAGVLLATMRPMTIGDFVEAAECEGFVEDIGLLYTTLVSLDNETMIIPNQEITGATITNYSAKPYTRVEVPLTVDHGADWSKVTAILEEAPKACPRVLADPPWEIQIKELSEVGIKLQIEVTTLAKDREDVMFEVSAEVKRRFDEAGIRIPHRMIQMGGQPTS